MRKIFFILLTLLVFGAILVLGFYFSKKSIKFYPLLSMTLSAEKNTGKEISNSKENVKILFVGDMMFDRWIRQVSENKGSEFIFQDIKDLLQNEDLVIGNLEGPITNNPSISLGSEIGSKENYIFTFPPIVAKNLYDENIHVVNIGNNHTLNFGQGGLSDTKNYLTKADIKFFGNTGKNDERYLLEDVDGIKIAFVNYNQFVKNGEKDSMDDLHVIKNLNPDFIVVYAHWGTEFKDSPSEYNKELAHKFIDAGADLVIGSHPHVIQSKEEYRGKMIYYSLGNFIFDQYFDTRAQKGLGVEIELNLEAKPFFKEYYFEMKNDGKTTIKL